MQRNSGWQPRGTAGKRIRGVLANGVRFGFEDRGAAAPGWAADTTRWSLTGDDWDVAEWELCC